MAKLRQGRQTRQWSTDFEKSACCCCAQCAWSECEQLMSPDTIQRWWPLAACHLALCHGYVLLCYVRQVFHISIDPPNFRVLHQPVLTVAHSTTRDAPAGDDGDDSAAVARHARAAPSPPRALSDLFPTFWPSSEGLLRIWRQRRPSPII